MYNIVNKITGAIIAWEYEIEPAIKKAKRLGKNIVIRDRETNRHIWGEK